MTRTRTYVIALPCVEVKDRAHIDERTVDSIYEGDRSLYIHPDESAAPRGAARAGTLSFDQPTIAALAAQGEHA